MESTSFSMTGGRSSEAREDRDVEEAEGRGLSAGEMSAEDIGVESVVSVLASRRRTASCGSAVVDMTGESDVVLTGLNVPAEKGDLKLEVKMCGLAVDNGVSWASDDQA